MSQVIVRRCVLRIRRTAGWTWGTSPDALLDAAARALPALIAARLPAIAATATEPVHVALPVRVRVEATLAELAALAAPPGASDSVASSASALGQRVGVAIETALRSRPPGESAGALAPAAGTAAPATEPRLRSASPRGNAEVEIRSVLPFLLLPALHHAGWLDTATALLEAHELTGAGLALAAALAGKLLDPPERGWTRSREDHAIMAAFAGTSEPIPGHQLTAAAVRLAPVLGALDDSLRAMLGRARRRGLPAILVRGACGWSVVDGDGLAVLASAPALPAVLASLGGALAEVLLAVPASCADPATLERIDLANLRFITDAPPMRGEVWRVIAGGGRLLWTNDTATTPGKLAASAADLEALVALAAELTGELDARPAIARAPSPALEATASLAVTAALADVAARLFPAEPATPILAMSRFRDLDARVRFEPGCVRVRIPLGRRHADLMRHGLLTTIWRVPWLGGRCVDLGGA